MMKLAIFLGMFVAVVFSAPAPKAGVVGVLPLEARSIHPSPLAVPAFSAYSAPLVAAPLAAPVAAVATAHSSQAVARTYNAAVVAPAAVPALHAAYAYSPYAVAPATFFL